MLQKHVERCEETLSAKSDAKEALAKEVRCPQGLKPGIVDIKCTKNLEHIIVCNLLGFLCKDDIHFSCYCIRENLGT